MREIVSDKEMSGVTLLSVKLDARLHAVAAEIARLGVSVHTDIGSDHARLPLYLLQQNIVQKIIAVEKHQQPFERSLKALREVDAEVRLGDGLTSLEPGETDSLSMSGMGAPLMVRILQRCPQKLPPHLVLQPNASPEGLRCWALQNGYHLVSEQMVTGFWRYTVLTFSRGSGRDKAYDGVPQELALRYGPLLLKENHPLLLEELHHQRRCLSKLQSGAAEPRNALATAEQALELFA